MFEWLGIYKEEMVKPEEKPEEKKETANFKEFMQSAEAQSFIKEWTTKIDKETGKPMYTKAGVTELLRVLYESKSFSTNAKMLKAAGEILTLLRGGDKLKSFLAGWKARSEGIMKTIKSLGGGLFKAA